MIRTSITHPLRIDEINLSTGTIGMTFCPGKKGDSVFGEPWDRDLEADLDVIAAWHPDAVVSLMEEHEFEDLQVNGLGSAVEGRGLAWHHLPIPDLGITGRSFERRWINRGHVSRDLLRTGGKVLIRCRGGLGRTGLVAARLLIEEGMSPDEAIALVRQARPGAIETSEQEEVLRTTRPLTYDYGYRDRVLGCFFGGAVGDAFGYAVEFETLKTIKQRHGPRGLEEPIYTNGRLIVSDDTQMTLFTGEALAVALSTESQEVPSDETILSTIRNAYLNWLDTQQERFEDAISAEGLLAYPEVWRTRAPGNTCLQALREGGVGTCERPKNNCKGCGGVTPDWIVGKNSGQEIISVCFQRELPSPMRSLRWF
ncbi:ADP-ribosylglycohydrolase family protein [Aerococcus mictus]|uniref:ADP-ribosylglycohydrolase family protein n=1 Tax=Aerococcus mictus TaxID=2976810 RepID=UPI002FD1BD8C